MTSKKPTQQPPKRGRPPSGNRPKKTKTFRLSATIADFLATRDDQTATVENAIAETPEFFAWDFKQDEKRKRKSNL